MMERIIFLIYEERRHIPISRLCLFLVIGSARHSDGSTSDHEVMLSWMEMRHSGVHLLIRYQEHPLCSTLCSNI